MDSESSEARFVPEVQEISMTDCWIYGLTDKYGTVWYIGRTQSPLSRLAGHNTAGYPKGIVALRNKIRHFDMKILEHCTVKTSKEREVFWIGEYRKVNPKLLNWHPVQKKVVACA